MNNLFAKDERRSAARAAESKRIEEDASKRGQGSGYGAISARIALRRLREELGFGARELVVSEQTVALQSGERQQLVHQTAITRTAARRSSGSAGRRRRRGSRRCAGSVGVRQNRGDVDHANAMVVLIRDVQELLRRVQRQTLRPICSNTRSGQTSEGSAQWRWRGVARTERRGGGFAVGEAFLARTGDGGDAAVHHVHHTNLVLRDGQHTETE